VIGLKRMPMSSAVCVITVVVRVVRIVHAVVVGCSQCS
jgi:hypothetical protein